MAVVALVENDTEGQLRREAHVLAVAPGWHPVAPTTFNDVRAHVDRVSAARRGRLA
jgi:hypothetical protein